MKVVIAGAGKLGTTLIEALAGGGNEITVLDKDDSVAEKINSRFDVLCITANAKSVEVLKEIKIQNYDLILSVTDSDEKNIFIASIAKKLGCKKAVARVSSPEHMEQSEYIEEVMGIDYLVSPDMACANEINKYLTEKYSFGQARYTSDGVSILEFNISKMPKLIDKQIKDCPLLLGGLLIGAVSRNGKIIVPNGNTKLIKDDMLYIIGMENQVNAVYSRVTERQFYTDLKTVMIAGGGKTGFFLAQKLRDFGASVKIIEQDRNRCEYLSSRLDNVLVIHGDATDPNLLREENMQKTDAFVAVTGFDEENLLLSLMANKYNIEDVVAKVSRKSYDALIDDMGVAMIINPMDMCATTILRYMKGDSNILFSQIIQGQAEFVEIWAEKGMSLIENTLAELYIPEGVIIAAIHRDDEIIIPKGSTKIREGDRVLILSLLSATAELESLIKVH